MDGKKKSCTDCKYRLSEDQGYSNYTVENTVFYCLLKLHPDMPFDEFYGEDERLQFAENCVKFTPGESVQIDVDRDGLKNYEDKLSTAYTTAPEIVPLLDAWEVDH